MRAAIVALALASAPWLATKGKLFGFTGMGQRAAQLCDAMTPAQKVGAYWCFRSSDATTESGVTPDGGVVSMSAQGSPEYLFERTCPNGPDCEPIHKRRLTSAEGYKSANILMPTGDLTACWLGQPHALQSSALISSWDSSYATFLLDLNGTGGSIRWVVYSTNVSTYQLLSASSVLATAGARHLICGVYDYIANGTSVLTLYVDGVSSNSRSDGVGPPAATSRPYTIGFMNAASPSSYFAGAVEGAFVTEVALSASDVQGLAKATNTFRTSATATTYTGSTGQSVTFTRSGVSGCSSRDGTVVTMLPGGRACFSGGGYVAEPPVTVVAMTSENLSAWTSSFGGGATEATVAANNARAPSGLSSLTADTLTFYRADGGDTSESRYCKTTSNCAALNSLCTGSVWLKSNTGAAQTAGLYLVNATSGTSEACVQASLDGGWNRFDVSNVSTGADNYKLCIGAYGGSAAGANCNPGADTSVVDVWGAQQENAPVASSYLQAGTSNVSRAGSTLTFTNPLSGVTPKTYCLGATFSPVKKNKGVTWVAPTTNQAAVTLGQYAGAYPNNYSHVGYTAGGAATSYFQTFMASSAGAAKTLEEAAYGLHADGGTTRVVGCYDNQTLRQYVNGFPSATSDGGTVSQTGLPATGYIGSYERIGNANYGSAGTTLSDICVGETLAACQ